MRWIIRLLAAGFILITLAAALLVLFLWFSPYAKISPNRYQEDESFYTLPPDFENPCNEPRVQIYEKNLNINGITYIISKPGCSYVCRKFLLNNKLLDFYESELSSSQSNDRLGKGAPPDKLAYRPGKYRFTRRLRPHKTCEIDIALDEYTKDLQGYYFNLGNEDRKYCIGTESIAEFSSNFVLYSETSIKKIFPDKSKVLEIGYYLKDRSTNTVLAKNTGFYRERVNRIALCTSESPSDFLLRLLK